jgi:16S rRNA (cytidine1402-2'-O)-methyltransferase
MPGICDPGEDIFKSVKSEGIDMICVPGACAAITALVSSGLPSSSFVFEGFLPKKKIDREKILLEISKNEKTTIIYESPKRLRKLLNELLELCGGDREIIVARELTKKFEEHVGNNIYSTNPAGLDDQQPSVYDSAFIGPAPETGLLNDGNPCVDHGEIVCTIPQ